MTVYCTEQLNLVNNSRAEVPTEILKFVFENFKYFCFGKIKLNLSNLRSQMANGSIWIEKKHCYDGV